MFCEKYCHAHLTTTALGRPSILLWFDEDVLQLLPKAVYARSKSKITSVGVRGSLTEAAFFY